MNHIKSDITSHPCNCIGPQRGEPLCPCRMRGVIIKDGRYVLPERDLGPVPTKEQRDLIELREHINKKYGSRPLCDDLPGSY